MDLPIKIGLPDGFLDDEVRIGYTVDSETKAIWAVELDLLSELQRICKKYNLIYYACAGTMLGAVRHNGIIPWDDDIDVMLLRKDYDILCKHSNEFKYPYFFQTETTDVESMRGHAQLRNSLTTGILGFDYNGGFSFNQGIFIDIFPLDNLPDDEVEKKQFIKTMIKKKNRCRQVRDIPTHPNSSPSKLKNMIRNIISPGLAFMNRRFGLGHQMFLKYEMQMKRYSNIQSKTVGIIAIADSQSERFQWNINDIVGETVEFPFEFMNITLPAGYLNMLRKTYGDWEKPVKAPSVHGSNIIFDPCQSYKEYFRNTKNKG